MKRPRPTRVPHPQSLRNGAQLTYDTIPRTTPLCASTHRAAHRKTTTTLLPNPQRQRSKVHRLANPVCTENLIGIGLAKRIT